MPTARPSAVPCPYPVIERQGECCKRSPCAVTWYRPCEADGGCWDRATCGDCAEPRFPSATDWLLEVGPHLEPITLEEQRQDELERLQAELEEIWARDDPDDEPRGHAEFAGRQHRCETICNRIAVLKGQR